MKVTEDWATLTIYPVERLEIVCPGRSCVHTNPKASRIFQLISRLRILVRLSLAWYNTAVPAIRTEAAALHRQRIARPGPGVSGDMMGRSAIFDPSDAAGDIVDN